MSGEPAAPERLDRPADPPDVAAWGAAVADREVDRAISALGGPDATTERQRDAVRGLARTLAARVLHRPVEGARAVGEAERASPEAIHRLFDTGAEGGTDR